MIFRPSPVVTALAAAHQQQRPAAAAPLAESLRSPEEAYAVQIAVGQALGWWGDAPALHWKSGGATLEGITHAPLPPAGVWASPAQAGNWPLQRRGIEAEVALRLGRPVDAALAVTLDQHGAEALIDAMAVSIEVVDSRWQEGPDAAPLLRLADGQSHGALVLGAWQPYDRSRDWARQGCTAHIGSQPAVTRQGSHPLDHPAAVLPAWLRHATRHGQMLPAGTVVTTGTWVGLLQAQAGDQVAVRFAGLGEATLQL